MGLESQMSLQGRLNIDIIDPFIHLHSTCSCWGLCPLCRSGYEYGFNRGGKVKNAESFCREKKLPIGLYLTITVIPVTPPSTHAVQSLAFTIQSPISIGPSCSSMTQKGVSVYHVNQHNVCVSISSVGCVCASYHAQSFWMMSCFLVSLSIVFPSGLLKLLCCSSLLSPSLINFFFFPPIWRPVFRYLRKAAEHSGIPVKYFLDCFKVTVYVVPCFFRLRVCWILKLDVQSLTLNVDRFLLPGRHWVSRFTTEPFSMKDRGIKAAAASNQAAALPNVLKNIDVSLWCFNLFNSCLLPLNVHCCCFYSPCPGLPFRTILFFF